MPGIGIGLGFWKGGAIPPLAIIAPTLLSFAVSSQPYALTGAELISFSDRENTGSDTYIVEIIVAENDVEEGTFTLGSVTGLTFNGGTTNGSSNLNFTGSLANINSALAAGGGADLAGADVPGLDTIDISFNKVGGGGVTSTIPFTVRDDSVNVEIPTTSLTINTYVPSVAVSIYLSPATAALTITGYIPSVDTGVNLTPGVATLTITGYIPSVDTAVNLTPAAAALSYTGYIPTVEVPSTGPDLSLNFLTATIGSDGAPVAD